MKEDMILIVDDEESVCELLHNALVQEGFEPDTTADGRQAIEMLERNHYDVVLLELNMSGISGLDVLKRIGELDYLTEVIIMTDNASLDSALETVCQGTYDYLIKPFEIREIARTVKNALAKQRLHRENLRLMGKLQERDRELEKARQYLANLMDSSIDAIISTDRSGRIVLFNSAAEEITGYKYEEAVGSSISQLLPEEEVEDLMFLIQNVMKEEPISHLDISIRYKKGAQIPLSATLSPIKDERGRLEGIVLVLRDLREKDRLQQQLIQSQKLAGLGQLAAGVAHELRNPLGIMNTCLYNIKQSLKASNPDIGEHLEILGEEISRSERIITSLLALSRKSNLQITPLDIKGILEDVLRITQVKISTSKIKVTRQYEGTPRALANEEDIRQALINIILNAIDAMRDGGRLGIRVRQVERRVVIEISDTGCGIPEENMSDIYNPFFTTKEVGEGIGLGLSLAHSIIRRYNGTIEAESEEGKGTTFVLTLPCESEVRDHETERTDTHRRR